MTKEEYKNYLCNIISAVLDAEYAVNKRDASLTIRLKSHDITPDEYIGIIADEILAQKPDDMSR